jgi:hypothetical protein
MGVIRMMVFKKGTSLVEALVASALLMIGMMGVLTSVFQSVNNLNTAKVNNIATTICHELANELSTVDFDNIPVHVVNLVDNYQYTFEGENIGPLGVASTEPVFFTIGPGTSANLVAGSADIYEIVIELNWLSRAKDRENSGMEADNLNYQHKFLVVRNEAD